MAPEQARGEVRNLDERCDVFGLGGILCEILTGTPPYHGATREELLPQAAEGDVRGAQARLEASPADKDLVGLAHRCLATEPQDRPRDAGVVSREITAYLASVQDRLRAAELERARALAKAVAERTTRRLTVGLAASLLAMVLLAGGVGWWYVSEQAKTERQVNESLDEAVRLWGQAREAPVGELSKWSEVRAAVRQAEALLAERVGNEQARKRIQDLVADLETEESLARGRAEEAKRDQEMIERLAEIRLRRSEVSQGHFDFEGADAAYASRFREYGIDVDNIDDAQATALIRAPAIRLRLAAALDDWASARRSIKDMPNASWQRLIKIARQADSDDFRTSLRTSLEQEDLKTLKELAARANIKALPAATLDLLGKSLFLAGDANSAIAVLQSAQREHPDDFWINHNLAKLFGKTKPPRPDQQVRYYSVAAALSSQSPGVYNNLGVALTHLGAPAEAAAAYRRAIDLQPEMAEAHSNLGDALASQGKTAEAIGELREAIRLKSNYFEAHFNLANVLTQGQRFEEAVSEYAKALQIQPNAALAQSNLGIALVRQGKTDEAIAAFRKAIKMDPAYPQAYCNLGSALSDNGANEEAIPKLQEAIRLKPDYTFAHLNLGTALWRTGKLDEAATSFRAASRLKPEHYVCHYYLGCVLMEKGLLDEALVPLRETLRYNPGNTNALMRIGEVQYRKGIFDEAIATFREIIRGDPNLAEAHCRLGQALKDKGQFADAVTEMKQAHELGSKDPKWPFPSGQWLKSYEGLAALDRKLSSHLKAEVKIDKVADQIELAEFCLKDKRSFATAALLFEKALLANPGLQDDDGSIRTNACRSALLAADGKSTDAANLSDPERRHWRTQAIAWLREDLDKCKKLKESGIAKDRDAIRSKLQNWQALPELKSMREKLFLAELSESDRKTCLDLWQEVDGLLSE
jgi:tetratricopeptide (TPR) repeat protein